MKSLLLAGDDAGDAARWALDANAADATSPIGAYAATLAHLVLRDDDAARALGETLRNRDDFPRAVADALVAIASSEQAAFHDAIDALLDDFEQRTDFLEDVPVADTVLVLHRLAAQCGLATGELRASPRLP